MQLMTRTKFSFSGLFSRVLTYITLASVISLTLHPWQAGFTKPVAPEAKQSSTALPNKMEMEEEPDLSDKWNEDIYAPNPSNNGPSPITQQVAPSKPSIHMERPVLKPAPQSAPVAVRPVIMPGQLDNPAFLQKQFKAEKTTQATETPTHQATPQPTPDKLAKSAKRRPKDAPVSKHDTLTQTLPHKNDKLTQSRPENAEKTVPAIEKQQTAEQPSKKHPRKRENAETALTENNATPANKRVAKPVNAEANPSQTARENSKPVKAAKVEKPAAPNPKQTASTPPDKTTELPKTDNKHASKREKTAKAHPETPVITAGEATAHPLPEKSLTAEKPPKLKKEKRKKEKIAKIKAPKPLPPSEQPITGASEPPHIVPAGKPSKPVKAAHAEKLQKPHKKAKQPEAAQVPPSEASHQKHATAAKPSTPGLTTHKADRIQAAKTEKQTEQVAESPEKQRVEKPKKTRKTKVAKIKDKPIRLPNSPVVVVPAPTSAGVVQLPEINPLKAELAEVKADEQGSNAAPQVAQAKSGEHKRKAKEKRPKHPKKQDKPPASETVATRKPGQETPQNTELAIGPVAPIATPKAKHASKPDTAQLKPVKQSKTQAQPSQEAEAKRLSRAEEKALKKARREERRKTQQMARQQFEKSRQPELSKPAALPSTPGNPQTTDVSKPSTGIASTGPVSEKQPLGKADVKADRIPEPSRKKRNRETQGKSKHNAPKPVQAIATKLQPSTLATSPTEEQRATANASTASKTLSPIGPDIKRSSKKQRPKKTKPGKLAQPALVETASQTASPENTVTEQPKPEQAIAAMPAPLAATQPEHKATETQSASKKVKAKKEKRAKTKAPQMALNPFPSVTEQPVNKPLSETQVFAKADSEATPSEKADKKHARKKRKQERSKSTQDAKQVASEPKQALSSKRTQPEPVQEKSETQTPEKTKPETASNSKEKRAKARKEKPVNTANRTIAATSKAILKAEQPQSAPVAPADKPKKSKRHGKEAPKPSTDAGESKSVAERINTPQQAKASKPAAQKPDKSKKRQPEKQAEQLAKPPIEPAQPAVLANSATALTPEIAPNPALETYPAASKPTQADTLTQERMAPITPVAPIAKNQPAPDVTVAPTAQASAEPVPLKGKTGEADSLAEEAQTQAPNADSAASVRLAQQKAAEYHTLLTQRLQSDKPGSFEPILQKGQEAAAEILRNIDALDDTTYLAISQQMQGYLLMRDEIIVVAPDPAYFLKESQQHGTPTDVAFFTLMTQTLNGYWPITMEQLTDLSGCTRFGSHDLTKLYGSWKDFRKKHPTAYESAFNDPNLLLLSDIEDQLLNSQAACEGPDTVIEELTLFIKAYPKSELTPKLKLRLESLLKKQSDMVYFQGVKHSLNK